MSCSWDIVCVDCRERAGIDNANHADELMRILIRHQRTIAAVGELAAELWSLDLIANTYYISSLFFKNHLGHQLRPISEYGTFDTTCGHDFVCPTCNKWVACDQQEHWMIPSDEHCHSFGRAFHWEKGCKS